AGSGDSFVIIYVVRYYYYSVIFFFQAEDGIRDGHVTGVQTCALPICLVQQRRPASHLYRWTQLARERRASLRRLFARPMVRHRRRRPLRHPRRRNPERSEERRVGKEWR